MMRTKVCKALGIAMFCALGLVQTAQAQEAPALDPVYPSQMSCGKITSPFRALRDLDGSLRAAPHVGIDLGDFGDVVIAPANGRVEAVWQVRHPWGTDWNILLVHSATDLNLPDAGELYYTEFDHLQRADMPNIIAGRSIQQGQPIGIVRHPGNNTGFRAEVHMEVHAVPIAQHPQTEWHDDDGITYWWNSAADLLDPLALMSLHMDQRPDHRAELVLYSAGSIPADFRGFVYPLQCQEN